MGYFGPYFMILVQPTSKVVFNALKSVTIPVLISYILLSDDVLGFGCVMLQCNHVFRSSSLLKSPSLKHFLIS